MFALKKVFLITIAAAITAAPAMAVQTHNESYQSTPFPVSSKQIAQREAYRQAKAAIKNGDYSEARSLQNGILKGYSLNVWLDYYYLTNDPETSKFKKVREFLKNSNHSELNRILTQKYVEYLGERGQFAKVNELLPHKPFADEEVNSNYKKKMQCRFYEARWHQNKATGDAVAFAASLYKNLKGYPSDCDSFVELWKSKGYLSDKERMAKFESAYVTNRYESVARSLASRLYSSDFGEVVGKAMNLYKNPSEIMSMRNDGSATTRRAAVLAFKRMASLDSKNAQAQFETFKHLFKPTVTENVEIAAILAEGLMSRNNSSKADIAWVDKNLPAVGWSDKLIELRLRRAIWYAQWDKTYDLISLLPDSAQKDINWQYWKGYSASMLGRKDESHQILHAVAKDRSFYGFLAAQKAGMELPYNHKKLSHNVRWPSTVADNEAVRRFFELYSMDDPNADIEWREIAKTASDDEAMLMADWALNTGNTGYAIQSVISGQRWDALSYRFPIPYKNIYTRYAKSTKVPLTFLYGISRQESMLNPVIRSPVGAVGLMQLMPGTAQMVSKKNHWKYNGAKDLIIPENNVRLGSMYLRNMLDKFDNNRILASAAYNAGPNRIYRWKSHDGIRRDAAMFVENIPFNETRDYVQKVLLYDAIYGRLINGSRGSILNSHEMNYAY